MLMRRVSDETLADHCKPDNLNGTAREIALELLQWRSMDRNHLLASPPIPLILFCPLCHERHIDEGAFAEKTHHTHACQKCGMAWRPALIATVGVKFLPGYKD